jgi:hypothetical protein
MKGKAKALISKNQNELPAARTLEVSLDRADNVIEGGQPFRIFHMTNEHDWIIPLQYVNAEELVSLLRAADRFGLKRSGFRHPLRWLALDLGRDVN